MHKIRGNRLYRGLQQHMMQVPAAARGMLAGRGATWSLRVRCVCSIGHWQAISSNARRSRFSSSSMQHCQLPKAGLLQLSKAGLLQQPLRSWPPGQAGTHDMVSQLMFLCGVGARHRAVPEWVLHGNRSCKKDDCTKGASPTSCWHACSACLVQPKAHVAQQRRLVVHTTASC